MNYCLYTLLQRIVLNNLSANILFSVKRIKTMVFIFETIVYISSLVFSIGNKGPNISSLWDYQSYILNKSRSDVTVRFIRLTTKITLSSSIIAVNRFQFLTLILAKSGVFLVRFHMLWLFPLQIVNKLIFHVFWIKI
jgi:hypothetical protein